jgi:hypothetical protein
VIASTIGALLLTSCLGVSFGPKPPTPRPIKPQQRVTAGNAYSYLSPKGFDVLKSDQDGPPDYVTDAHSPGGANLIVRLQGISKGPEDVNALAGRLIGQATSIGGRAVDTSTFTVDGHPAARTEIVLSSGQTRDFDAFVEEVPGTVVWVEVILNGDDRAKSRTAINTVLSTMHVGHVDAHAS